MEASGQTYKVVSTQTQVSLTCSLVNSDQTRGAMRFITPLHFLDFDVIIETTRKTVILQKEIIIRKRKVKLCSSNYS